MTYTGIMWFGHDSYLLLEPYSEAPTELLWFGHDSFIRWGYMEDLPEPQTNNAIFFGMNF